MGTPKMKQNRVIIALAIVVLLAVLFLVIRLHNLSKREVISRFQEQQLLHAHHVAEQIESFFSALSRGLEAFTTSNSFDEGMKQLRLNLQTYSRKMEKNFVTKISLYDENGITSYSTDLDSVGLNDGQSDFFILLKQAENRKKVFVFPLFQTMPNRGSGTSSDPYRRPPVLQFLIAIPLYFAVHDKKDPKLREKFAGVLSLVADLKTYISNELIDSPMTLHEVWIIEKSGTVLFHSVHPEMASRNIYQGGESCHQCHASFDYAERILKRREGTLTYNKEKSKKKLAGFAPMEFQNASWVVVTDIEDLRVTSFINKSLRDHMILLGIIVFAMFGSSVLIIRNNTSRMKADQEARHLREKIIERDKAEKALKESEERLRFLSSEILTAQEKERSRISSELHDELGPALATLKLRVGLIRKSTYKEQVELRKECEQTLEYLDQVIDDIRRFSQDLRPYVLAYFGLSAGLRRLLNDFSKSYDIKVNLDIIDLDPFFPPEEQTAIYRIFQEIVNNAAKYSRATCFSVVTVKKDGAIFFKLEDDGKGFDRNSVSMRDVHRKGLGLDILNERIRMLGGQLDLWSQEGKGTRITFNIPLKEGDIQWPLTVS
jgi:signal transduction histidine kinase